MLAATQCGDTKMGITDLVASSVVGVTPQNEEPPSQR